LIDKAEIFALDFSIGLTPALIRALDFV